MLEKVRNDAAKLVAAARHQVFPAQARAHRAEARVATLRDALLLRDQPDGERRLALALLGILNAEQAAPGAGFCDLPHQSIGKETVCDQATAGTGGEA